MESSFDLTTRCWQRRFVLCFVNIILMAGRFLFQHVNPECEIPKADFGLVWAFNGTFNRGLSGIQRTFPFL